MGGGCRHEATSVRGWPWMPWVSVYGIEAASSHASTILPLKYIEVIVLGWAMVGQSSGETRVGIKIDKNMSFLPQEMVM